MLRVLFTVLLLSVLAVITQIVAQPFSERDLAFLGDRGSSCAYLADNAVFNGQTQYMRKVADFSDNGLGDQVTFTFSCWVKRHAINADHMIYFSANGSGVDRMHIYLSANNVLRLAGFQFSGAQVFAMVGSNTVTVDKGWMHLFAAVNLADATQTKIYINGMLDATNAQTRVNTAIDMSGINHQYLIGIYPGNLNSFHGAMAEFWFNDTYIDNPTLFITNGCPVDLGADGTNPGQTPVFYFKGSNNLFNVVIGSTSVEGNWGITNGPLTFTNTRPRVGAL